jgi:hypothetical protein
MCTLFLLLPNGLRPAPRTLRGTCVWAGVDNAWKQVKPEARKMLLNRADSRTSGARCVSLPCFGRLVFTY